MKIASGTPTPQTGDFFARRRARCYAPRRPVITKSDILRVARSVERFWAHDIWRIDRMHQDLPYTAQLGILVARSLYIVVSGFRRERIRLRAASLTYVSLLSLVPALAVVFSLFTAFGGLEDTQAHLKALIIDALAVNQREVVLEYLERFVGQTHAARLGTVGTAFLLLTVISLLTNIERAFNDIWGVRRARSMLRRFQVYWPLVTLGPIVIGLSLSTNAAVEASDTYRQVVTLAPSLAILIQLGPLLLTCLFFTFLYMVIPNTKVPFRCALVGGIVGGGLWSLAQKLYAIYAAHALTYSAIYGSLGAVPLFVIWVYVSWTVALLGATLTFAVQSVRTFEPERVVSQEEREFVAARLMVAVAAHFGRGGGPVSGDAILAQVMAPPRLARTVLGDLVQAGLLAETSGEDTGFVPGRPLDQITLAQVVAVMRSRNAAPHHVDQRDSLSLAVSTYLDRAVKASETELAQESLQDLVTATPPQRHRRGTADHASRPARGPST
jgi:membrane protein